MRSKVLAYDYDSIKIKVNDFSKQLLFNFVYACSYSQVELYKEGNDEFIEISAEQLHLST